MKQSSVEDNAPTEINQVSSSIAIFLVGSPGPLYPRNKDLNGALGIPIRGAADCGTPRAVMDKFLTQQAMYNLSGVGFQAMNYETPNLRMKTRKDTRFYRVRTRPISFTKPFGPLTVQEINMNTSKLAMQWTQLHGVSVQMEVWAFPIGRPQKRQTRLAVIYIHRQAHPPLWTAPQAHPA